MLKVAEHSLNKNFFLGRGGVQLIRCVFHVWKSEHNDSQFPLWNGKPEVHLQTHRQKC